MTRDRTGPSPEGVTTRSGPVVSYGSDNPDRVTYVAQSGQVWATSFGYHATGALAAYTSGNGQTTAITYDPRQRPDQLTSGPLSLDYDYDDVGNVASITDARAGFSQGFAYDPLDRLTAVTGFGAATYTYDARGNRTSRNSVTYSYDGGTDRLTSDGVSSFTYDGVGNLATTGTQTYTYTPMSQVQTAAVAGVGTTEYWYDADQQRRLRRLASGTREYFVPGPGLVPLAEYRKAAGGSRELVREYIYAGDRLIASVGLEPSPLASVTWTDDPIVAGVTEVKAVHLTELRDAVNAARTAHGLAAASWTDATVTPGVTVIQAVHITELRTAIDAVYTTAGATPPSYTDPTLTQGVTAVKAVHFTELRAARANAPAAEVTATRFYHLDALGSVRAVTDASGATVRRHDYAPFGEEPSPAAGADARRFTGKERDAETGLDYFSARYYLSAAGRFTTVDPKMGTELALEDPQRWNRYSYAGNRPTRIVDPDGRGWVSKLVKLAIKGGDVAATFADVVDNVNTVFDDDKTVGERVWAAVSAASELAPVSIGDVKHGAAVIGGLASKAVARGKALESLDGRISEAGFLDAALRWLGEGYREVSPGRYISKDGRRQFRFGKDETKKKLHGHFEAYDDEGNQVIYNTRVDIIR